VSTKTLIKIENLCKTFGTGVFGKGKQVSAVENVSFELKAGEITGLIGESGSGKTTTARLILKLLKPTSGKISYEDVDIWKIPDPEYYRRVQGGFQDPYSAINPIYRIKHTFDNVFNLVKDSTDNKVFSVKEVLEWVGLRSEDVLERHIHELSGGQLQKILIARCLIIDPKVIVIDEPTSMVDASARVLILNLLKKLTRERKKHILFITHDISQAFYICDRLLIMYKGKLVEQNTTEQVVFNPQDFYTKRLIADVPKLRQKFEMILK
jgi:peptide/nickel transport system ATP-binding protein